ncbi:hypothetical protein J0895_18285 [Phormidium pseudopriestleyi FRX01]|uniref:Uncharacterized protein n=1 Tax=Phormidium pseudopriestleyi FRX01 TaxID=1759528 RepID=A0ABS3FV30_9CYAN|nr:hypothetical protein [Phormidium pseudopriestleyi]MBO0350980.1 hypothetical protein [Phormidium pseudopriestleyi FRX01]
MRIISLGSGDIPQNGIEYNRDYVRVQHTKNEQDEGAGKPKSAIAYN